MDESLVVPGPLHLERTLERHRLWGEDPVNRLAGRVFRRAVEVDGRWVGYRLTWTGGPETTRITVSVPGVRTARAVEAAVADARHLCGLELDLPGFYRFAARDRVLAGLVPVLYGLRPTLCPRPFEMLVGSVCAQQVNLAFAFTVRARLARAFGTAVGIDGDTVYAFPGPRDLAAARVADLRRMQFTVRKAEYIVGLARRVMAGELDLERLRSRSNEEVVRALTAVRGFGRWTAEWFLARGLGRGDVCPAGDLGVRKAFAHFYNRGRELSEQAIRRRADAWGPHQNLAVHYLLAAHRLGTRQAGGGT